ncbi:MAG: class I SAM-dependent methyltransferase [Deltaproteobacteria bacterium]|nr:class I SAM-dependent methyltransferase [Deltaproteobacteria bacterium]
MRDEITYADFLSYFPYAPTALVIKECVRLGAMKEHGCPPPILDVGCGDGLFARLAFEDAEVWGIDIDGNEARRAQASRSYSQVVLADVTTAHLPKGFFGACVANCSLEHVPDLPAAARNILAALRPGGVFYAFVPDRAWAGQMLSSRLLRGLKLGPLAGILDEAVNTVFKHHHLEDAEGWRAIFEDVGFVVDRVEPVGSTASTMAFEAFLLPSLLGWVNKKVTGRWTLTPGLRKAASLPVYAMVKSVLELNPLQAPTAEYLLIAHRPAEQG